MTEIKLMAKESPTSGLLSDYKRYTFNAYDGDATLKELVSLPDFTADGYIYDVGTKTAIPAVSLLTILPTSLTVDPNGVGQATAVISGGVGNAGKTVKMVSPFGMPLPVDAFSWVLDGAGDATVTFERGTKLRCMGAISVLLNLEDGTSPAPVELALTLE